SAQPLTGWRYRSALRFAVGIPAQIVLFRLQPAFQPLLGLHLATLVQLFEQAPAGIAFAPLLTDPFQALLGFRHRLELLVARTAQSAAESVVISQTPRTDTIAGFVAQPLRIFELITRQQFN